MAITRRETAILVGGLVLGIAGAWALFANGDETAGDDAAARSGAPAGATAAAPAPAISAALCRFERTLPDAGDGDGQVALESDLHGKGAQDVRDLLVKGKEASAAGHRRDAETAFLMACRAAGELSGDDRILLADAMYRLGRHYAMVEPTSPAGKRDDLKQRARDLYATSLQAYRARYGDEHEKTRFADKALAALGGAAAPVQTETAKAEPGRTDTAKAESAKAESSKAERAKTGSAKAEPGTTDAGKTQAAAVAVQPAPAAPPKPVEAARQPPVVAASRAGPTAQPKTAARAPQVAQRKPEPVAEPRREVAAAGSRARPSFDCAKARSATEKIICADEDLARQDRELGRLHARAKNAAADPRDFQRRSDAEWSRREAECTTRECLQRWYAQRREDLGREVAQSRRDTREERETTARVAAPRPPERERPAVVVARPAPAVVAADAGPAVAEGEASVGQATGDAGDAGR